jgi:DNA-directed RNA polymerase subunit B'
LINDGIVEYIDAEEEENALIALRSEDITTDHTHMELDPMCILGIGASLVPYPEHNSSPRITVGAGMGNNPLGSVRQTIEYDRTHGVICFTIHRCR